MATTILTSMILSAMLAQSLDQGLDNQRERNPYIAIVGDRLITFADVLLEWSLRRRVEPHRPANPSDDEQEQLLREIVEEWLWIDHAQSFERYRELTTRTRLDRYGRQVFPELYEAELPPAERAVLNRWVESRYARESVLLSDPEIQRLVAVRPRELMDYYHRHQSEFTVPAAFRLGRVAISRNEHGEATEQIARDLRQQAVEGTGLEAAAQALGLGSYRDLGWYRFEDAALRDEVLRFARSAEVGQISEAMDMTSSIQIFEVMDRTEEQTYSFDEKSGDLRMKMRNQRLENLAKGYLVLRVMPKAYFEPANLFDEELARWGYLRRGR